jgi:hypothetical protein
LPGRVDRERAPPWVEQDNNAARMRQVLGSKSILAVDRETRDAQTYL